jgi:hypothetical protein
MRHFALRVVATVCALSYLSSARAASCANGVYRAGCAGPNGAVVVRKPPVVLPPALYQDHAPRSPVPTASIAPDAWGPMARQL